MGAFEELPEGFRQAQRGLQPYIKERQEASSIRRILAAHLSSHVSTNNGSLISQPLSLVDGESNVESPFAGVKGIRKDYIRRLRVNIKARREYDDLKREHRSLIHRQGGSHREFQDDVGGALEPFLVVVKNRRQHERLRIFQDYVDMLAQKPAATSSHLDPKLVLRDVESLPKVPEEVMNPSTSHHDSERTDLKELVEKLAKSVLRAKLLLKKEQTFLAKIRVDGSGGRVPTNSHKGRLQALGMARNELINWIETELAMAGESPTYSSEGQDIKVLDRRGIHFVENQLASIHGRYLQYNKARKALLHSATGKLELTAAVARVDAEREHPKKQEAANSVTMSHVLYPYLKELALISNEQKSTSQQKSHLTINLAKQLKESSQGLERLVGESHLLPAHPLPAASSQRKGPSSFTDEISSHEKPQSSVRARAWVFASDSATLATLNAVSENLEEGEKSTSDVRQSLLKLQYLIGEAMGDPGFRATDGSSAKLDLKDIWGLLDGNLGAIQTDDLDP